MSYEPVQPEYFNPCPDSTGLDLFELWETQAENDFYLIGINSTPYMFGALKEGDFIPATRAHRTTPPPEPRAAAILNAAAAVAEVRGANHLTQRLDQLIRELRPPRNTP